MVSASVVAAAASVLIGDVRAPAVGTPQGAGPQSLWPTPVSAVQLEALVAPALRAQLSARAKSLAAASNSSSALPWRTAGSNYLEECAGGGTAEAKQCAQVKRLLSQALRQYLLEALKQSPGIAARVRISVDESWMSVNGPGAYEAPHVHAKSGLAGSYYLECAEEQDGARCSEALEDPRTPAATSDLPHELRERLGFGVARTMHLRPGSVLIHPSWLVHASIPHSAPGYRVALSFTAGVGLRETHTGHGDEL